MKTSFYRCCLVLLALVLTGCASGGIVGPQREHLLPPTSQLMASGGPLVLDKGDLRMACDDVQCRIVAAYVVTAPAAMNVDFAFLAPQGVRVVSMVNGMPELPRVEPLQALATAGGVSVSGLPDLRTADGQNAYRNLLWTTKGLGAFQPENDLKAAFFTARLQAGKNNLSLTYAQPLAWFAASGSSRKVSLLQYELWPLAQWSRDPAFTLNFDLRVKQPVPGWWQKHFGRVLNFDAYTATVSGARTPLSAPIVRENDYLTLQQSFVETLPQRLLLVIGEERDLETSRRMESLVFR